MPLKLTTFNIRYAGAQDEGEKGWIQRSSLVKELVRAIEPDVFGAQEALWPQVEFLSKAFPEFSWVGVGRDDGRYHGEFVPIFYRSSIFRLVDSGTFWLSDTPEIMGSATWENQDIRICTWARLQHEFYEFTVFNTHFDHVSQPSRTRSASLLLSRIGSGPAVIMGDLNAEEDNPAVKQLVLHGLTDTFRIVHRDAIVGTFNDFDPGATERERIDYILTSPHLKILGSGIDQTVFDGRCASDHFPVWAIVDL